VQVEKKKKGELGHHPRNIEKRVRKKRGETLPHLRGREPIRGRNGKRGRDSRSIFVRTEFVRKRT